MNNSKNYTEREIASWDLPIEVAGSLVSIPMSKCSFDLIPFTFWVNSEFCWYVRIKLFHWKRNTFLISNAVIVIWRQCGQPLTQSWIKQGQINTSKWILDWWICCFWPRYQCVAFCTVKRICLGHAYTWRVYMHQSVNQLAQVLTGALLSTVQGPRLQPISCEWGFFLMSEYRGT